MTQFVVFIASLLIAGAQQPQASPASTPVATTATITAPTAKIWIGREQEFEDFLVSAPIEKFEEVKVGVTKPRRGHFAPGGVAASIVFKPLPPGRPSGFFESYKSEIAAYRLDRLLQLGMVPPTVEKRHKHEIGSAQLWVEGCVWLKAKTEGGQRAPNISSWNRQVQRQRVWDNLTANIDRNQGNLLVDEGWNLILIDHSRAFTNSMKMPFPMYKIDRPLFERLKALTREEIEAQMKGLLFDGPKSLLKRRDRIVQHFETLIQQRGEAVVITE